MRLTDWRGNEYGVGDKVFYPTGYGSGSEMVLGEVLAIEECEEERWSYQTRERVSHTVTRVKVQGIKGSMSGERDGHPAWPNIKNITVIDHG
ncbi:hypothetical protein E6W39_19040 [Kitasatospora acidiphila]|uniref:Uncharacterized protein n=1 Tax=Kitasatospora acidiphila TaxID=2567942 RepID=A0A540W4I7_9ACTN|nr:hypothetical protein [Kitasatospora acidiphila]TQF03948.1 hypothetical protein E6W39_19040 [Kitasatospora acidiphila]